MNILKGLLLSGIGLFWAHQALTQSFSETALLFSRTQPGGSARIQGIGGTQIALGGDYSSAYSNPAGLGMFNRSEATFTPAINFSNVSADYLNQTTNSSKSTFNIPGLSLTFHNSDLKIKGLQGGTFSISYSRISDFNRNLNYHGTNEDNSIIDYFIEDATGGTPDQFKSGGALYNTPTELAYDNYLIGEATLLDPANSNTEYFTDVAGIPVQHEIIETRGAQNQWNFSYGANFNDKVFIGAGVGLASIRYKSKKIYTEDFVDEPLSDLLLEETLEIRGPGINATLGTIFRPADFIQFGASATTPTAYHLTDSYSASMNTYWKNFEYLPGEFINDESANTDVINSEYPLKTPWKFSGGVAFFIKKHGFITVDIESLNYSKAKYGAGSDGVSYSDDNEKIKSLYQSVINLRFGGEFRFNKFRFRGGYGYMPEPFKNEQNGISRMIQNLSGGIGYRTEKFYIDFATIFKQGNNSYRPYRVNTATSPLVKYNQSDTNLLLTIGFPF
ncbi:MAG: hypothetical protein AABY93_09995 [Bacteroidota bacterium]